MTGESPTRPCIGKAPQWQPPEQQLLAAGRIFCIGTSDALHECIKLAESWHYDVSHDDDASGMVLPAQTLIITELALAPAVSRELPANHR